MFIEIILCRRSRIVRGLLHRFRRPYVFVIDIA